MAAARRLAVVDTFREAEQSFGKLVNDLRTGERLHMKMSELEALLDERGRELMRQLLQAHLDLRAQGSVGDPVIGSDGVERAESRDSGRDAETMFGTVRVNRERFHETGSEGLSPLDAELNLPPEKATLAVQRRIAEEASRGPYDEVVEILEKTTGASVAKRQAEEIAVRASCDFEEFYETQREVPEFQDPAPTPEIVVLSTDGKGVAVRKEDLRPVTRKAAEKKPRPKLDKRLSKGEKRNRKRMATVAAVYTVAPFVRTPEEVVAMLAAAEEPAIKARRPKPERKRVWASLEHEVEEVMTEVFAEALARDPKMKAKWAALVDGNETQITALMAGADNYGIQLTIVLDIIHVIERLWKAGTAFEREGTKQLERWVSDRLIQILRGNSSNVAAGMRRSATKRCLDKKTRKPVDACADYLLKYRDFLHYNEYLANGLPIATGVIEGTCRHLVGRRMEPGLWSLGGAEAVLRLRALRQSGDFDEYWAYHEQREFQRNHEEKYLDGNVPQVQVPATPRLRVVK
jgi:hypothetical protein